MDGLDHEKKMKKIALALALFTFGSYSYGSSTLAGEYLCDNCHGYLTVKPNKGNTYQVWLGVGGGSCGGIVFAKNDVAQPLRNKFTLTWKNEGTLCKTEISVEGNHVFVSDSCLKPESEENSTCAVLGTYTKRNAKK